MPDANEQFRFSKSEVNRAGETLVKNPRDEQAMEMLESWRYLHSGLLGSGKEGLFGHENSPLWQVSSRLKRSVSIIEKLVRFPEMKLSRMQDIAGIRGVCMTGTPELQLTENPCYTVKKTANYLETPRESGYRAIHHILEIRDMLLEIQLRTRPQHLWAMAVETVGMFYGQALKSNRGDQGWLDFFRLASALLSTMEGTPAVREYRDRDAKELRQLLHRQGHDQSFFSKLTAIRRIHDQDSSGDYEYWLLDLDLKTGTCEVDGFRADQIRTAHKMYTAKEQTPPYLRGDKQIVLVSTSSFKDLRQNYPSYFLDVADFLEMIQTI